MESARALEAEDRLTDQPCKPLTCWRSGIWKGTDFPLPRGKRLGALRLGFKVSMACFKWLGW